MADTSPAADNALGKPSYRRALSNKSLLYLWTGQIVSRSGDFIFDVAFVLLVLKTTGSVFDVGLVAGVSAAPNILAPLVGTYIDRTNRRNLLVWSNAAQAAVCALIAVLYSSGRAPFAVVLLLLFFLNAGGLFTGTAVSALIPKLVVTEDLAAANGLFSVTGSFNQVIFYGLGGAIVALIGYTLPIYYDSVTFLFALMMILLISPGVGVLANPVVGRTSFLASLKEGLVYVRRNALLFELVIAALVVNFFVGAFGALIAPYLVDSLGAPDSLFGFGLTALAAGSLVGALMVGKVQLRKHVGKTILGGIAAIGIVIIFMALVPTVPSALASLAALGVLVSVVNIPVQVLIQAKAPNEMLGRVFGVVGALASLTVPVASVASGSLASALSILGAYRIFGAATILSTAITFFLFRALREAKY